MYGSGLSEKRAEILALDRFLVCTNRGRQPDSGLVTTTPVLDTDSIVTVEAFIEENEL